jgi:hypothetical protein
MPLWALIFLHSERADGCNAWHAHPRLLRSENRVKAVTGCADRSPTAADVIEDELRKALAICEGDAALRITLIANAFPEAEIDRLSRDIIRPRAWQSQKTAHRI